MPHRWVPVLAALAVVAAVAAVYGVRSIDDETPVPDSSALRLGDLAVAAAPTTGYVHNGVLHGDDERRLDLGALASLAAYAVLDTGILVTGRGSGGDEAVQFLPDDGEPSEVWDAGYLMGNEAIAASADGSLGAFIRGDATPALIEDGRYVALPKAPDTDLGYLYPVAVLNGGAVIYHADVPGSGPNDGVETWRAERTGTVAARLGIRQVEAIAANGLVAGTTRIIDDGDGACAGVADEQRKLLWRTCHRRLVDFSPDGRHVLGTQNAADSFGDNRLQVYDSRTGETVLNLRTGGEDVGIFQMRWEDDEHLLLVLGEEGERDLSDDLLTASFAVVRVGLDGSREYAVAPVETREEPYVPALVLPVQ